MSISTVHTVALHGLTGHLVTLTATAADGPPAITLTGGDGQDNDRELRNRVRAALTHSGQTDRHRRVEVHLDPFVALPHAGAAVAVAALAAAAGISTRRLSNTAVLGDVHLDGSLRPTRGVLPAVQAARAHGIRQVIVPAAALGEAALINDLSVLGAYSLNDIAHWLRGDIPLLRPGRPPMPVAKNRRSPGWLLTPRVLRALEVAAAGGHHVLLDAAHGIYASLVAADWLHILLPDLTPAHQLDVAAIQSLTGQPRPVTTASNPPMATIHSSKSIPSLVGGTQPGAVSQAHRGLLVARDLDQFTQTTLDELCGALRRREVLLARGGNWLRYPAGFQLFATYHRNRYDRQPPLPLPLLDAIDIQLRLAKGDTVVSQDTGADDPSTIAEVLEQTRKRVADARARAAARWNEITAGMPGADGEVTNAAVPVAALTTLPLPAEVTFPVHSAHQSGAVSGRDAEKVLRLAYTLADLDGREVPTSGHIEDAMALRRVPTTTGAPTEREVR